MEAVAMDHTNIWETDERDSYIGPFGEFVYQVVNKRR